MKGPRTVTVCFWLIYPQADQQLTKQLLFLQTMMSNISSYCHTYSVYYFPFPYLPFPFTFPPSLPIYLLSPLPSSLSSLIYRISLLPSFPIRPFLLSLCHSCTLVLPFLSPSSNLFLPTFPPSYTVRPVSSPPSSAQFIPFLLSQLPQIFSSSRFIFHSLFRPLFPYMLYNFLTFSPYRSSFPSLATGFFY